MISFFETKTNGIEIAQLLIDLLEVKLSHTTLKKEIEQHPDYPSLLSISDVLNRYDIKNIAIKSDPDKFDQIPVPFITQVRSKKNSDNLFTVVKEISGNTIHFFEPEGHKWTSLKKNDFLTKCSGLVLLAEIGYNAGEHEYYKKIKDEQHIRLMQWLAALCIPAIVVVCGIIAFIKSGINALLPFTFSLLTLAGCGVSALIFFYELDQHNPVLQRICSTGKKVNCGNILQSPASKLAGISWSVIGFSYFLLLLLLIFFYGIESPTALFTAAWLNSIAVFYTFFSVYYQWRVAKQWCMLCLGIQALLILQLTMSIIGHWHNLLPITAITPELFVAVISGFIVPFMATAILSNVLRKNKENSGINSELQRIKHNRQIFDILLQKQKELTESPEGLGLTIGNPQAPHKLIKVCNPYCGPCAKAHELIEELLNENLEMQLQIIFTATNNEGDFRTPLVKHLLAIAEINDEAVIKQVLSDWYGAKNKDYESFALKHPLTDEFIQDAVKIEQMHNWCEKVKIDSTPTFFISTSSIDGAPDRFYQLPEIYDIGDLKYFFSVLEN